MQNKSKKKKKKKKKKEKKRKNAIITIDATFWRCIDVNAALYERHVPAGIRLELIQYLHEE